MSELPEALRLANSLSAHSLSRHGQTQAADELRRLHDENEKLLRALRLIENTDPLAASLDPEWAVRLAKWALEECK